MPGSLIVYSLPLVNGYRAAVYIPADTDTRYQYLVVVDRSQLSACVQERSNG